MLLYEAGEHQIATMSKHQITRLIEGRIHEDGQIETGIPGVRLFKASVPIPCTPAVYEPSVVVIVSGSKEAVLDGERHIYDAHRYLCCPLPMPVQAGTPKASPEDPLIGVNIALNPRVLTELSMELEHAGAGLGAEPLPLGRGGIRLARWDEAFSDALLRLLQLGDSAADTAILAKGRLRELYYAIMKGEAGGFARQAFSVSNPIARSISHLSANLDEQISIDTLASRAGMSRARFHRRFKEATRMSPIQFIKAMRLNSAAMNIAAGMTVSEAASKAGYLSPSQFSREFKRSYGQPPRQWRGLQTTSLERFQ